MTLRETDRGFRALVEAASSNPREESYKTNLFGYAWDRHRSLMIHEWAHVLQLLSYPLLFLRSARAGRVMSGPAVYMAAHPGRYSLPLQLELDERWRLSSMLGTIGFRADVAEDGVKLSPVESGIVARGTLTERDLIEEDATVFQYRAEIAGRGTGKAYRNWLRERPRYTRLFAFLARHFGDDGALRALPVLVRVAYRTTRPIKSFFKSFGTIIAERRRGWDLIADQDLDDEALEDILFSNLRGHLGSVDVHELTMAKPELDDPASIIDDQAFETLATSYQQLTISPLTDINLHGSEEQRGVVTEALRTPWRFFNRWSREVDSRLVDYLPPAITITLDDPTFPFGSSLLVISPLLDRTEFPLIKGHTYADWLNAVLKARMLWRVFPEGMVGDNTRCPHASCAYHPSGLCRGWMTIPAQAADCEFPGFFTTTTKHTLSADGTAVESIEPMTRT